jgi:LysM repeat protein
VTWGAQSSTVDKFVNLEVQAVATGTKLTVFLYSRPWWCNTRNDTFYDSTTLVLTAAGTAPTATNKPGVVPTAKPGATFGVPAGSIVAATPQADGSIIHTVKAGETCTGIAVTYGITYDELFKLNNLSFDKCKFIYVGQKLTIKAAGGAAPPPTAAPAGGDTGAAPTEAPTTAPLPTQVAEVQKSTICVLAFADDNANAIPEPAEGKLPGITFTVSNASGPLTNYTTDGTNEPHCFSELDAGSYTVTWTGSGTPTSEQTWPVDLAAGTTASRQFGISNGSTNLPGGPVVNPETPTDSGFPVWAMALIGAVGVILFLGGLGVVGYFLLLRRTKI